MAKLAKAGVGDAWHLPSEMHGLHKSLCLGANVMDTAKFAEARFLEASKR